MINWIAWTLLVLFALAFIGACFDIYVWLSSVKKNWTYNRRIEGYFREGDRIKRLYDSEK